jgi:hypothetical protein
MQGPMKNRLFKIIPIIVISLFLYAPNVQAALDLPNMMTGKTILYDIGSNLTYYSGMGGNYTVLDPVPENLGFDGDTLSGCSDVNLDPGGACFVLINGFPGALQDTSDSAVTVMTSRVSSDDGANQYDLIETPALLLRSSIIAGDSKSGNNASLSDFAYWGRNLAQTSGTANISSSATWKMGGYTVDSNSQAGSDQTDYNNKINQLMQNGTVITASELQSEPWYLQTSGSSIHVGPSVDPMYPEGKVWVVKGDVTLSTSITYYGIGTIIITGNLIVGDHVDILASDGKVDKLGIIILGN